MEENKIEKTPEELKKEESAIDGVLAAYAKKNEELALESSVHLDQVRHSMIHRETLYFHRPLTRQSGVGHEISTVLTRIDRDLDPAWISLHAR